VAGIALRRIAKSFGSFAAIEGLDLEIRDRELMVFLGPSGCGKTTTMRMIAGLEEPTAGEVWIGDEMVNDVEPRDRDVAMVFQSYALYPTMTIYENIRFPLRMRGVPRAEHDRLVRRAAEIVELGDLLHRKPKALSGGQRQRAALARAVVRSPQVFLMDEPLSNLDAKLRQSMRVQLKHIQKELQVTTVYVTHDQIEAMTLADRIAVMDHGRIQQLGTPDEIYNDPQNLFVAQFIGSPQMNVLDGEIRDGRFQGRGFSIPLPGVARSGPAKLGIRPEDLRLDDAATDLRGAIYGVEPTGDLTFATVTVGDSAIVVKAPRDYRAAIDTPVGLVADPARVLLFDPTDGRRLRDPVARRTQPVRAD
jgi:multiple sugar transport system ATP-binding protein